MSAIDGVKTWFDDSILFSTNAVPTALNETLQLVFVPFLFVIFLGIPLGVILYITAPGGLSPLPWLNRILGTVVNIARSLPFLVLVIALWPLGRLIVGSSLGTVAAMVPLAIGTIPFAARLIESSLREVDSGKIDAARVVGATRWQIITKTLLPEAKSGIISGLTITIIALLGYSALAGVIGGGGLGDLAIRYGARSYDGPVLWTTVLILILMAQIFQVVGDYLARKADHRSVTGGRDVDAATTAPRSGPPRRRGPVFAGLAAVVVVLLVLGSVLWLRGGSDENKLTIAATQVPQGEILEFIKQGQAAEAGLDFEVRIFDDYSLGNRWLSEGDIDANYFQHEPYLKEQVAAFGYQLHAFPGVHIEPYAVFSERFDSIDEVPDGATVSITDDGSNQVRALALLASEGLVTLPESGDVSIHTVGNPRNLQFTEAAPDLQARSVSEVDLAILNGNFFLNAGLSLSDALIVEDVQGNPYANFLVSREDNKDDPSVVKLDELLHSDETRAFIEERWPRGDVAPAF